MALDQGDDDVLPHLEMKQSRSQLQFPSRAGHRLRPGPVEAKIGGFVPWAGIAKEHLALMVPDRHHAKSLIPCETLPGAEVFASGHRFIAVSRPGYPCEEAGASNHTETVDAQGIAEPPIGDLWVARGRDPAHAIVGATLIRYGHPSRASHHLRTVPVVTSGIKTK